MYCLEKLLKKFNIFGKKYKEPKEEKLLDD